MDQHIELSNVTKSFPDAATPAVRNVSLSIDRGEIVALLGPSGCGKTTTLRLIAGFESPEDGTITIAGRVVANHQAFLQPEHRGVGMVFQDYALFPHLTVRDNIAFGLRRRERSTRNARVDELIELTGLSEFEDRYPHQLSGGQQQRVAMARALAPEPHVLLLDEPFSNLDTELRFQMRAEVRNLLKQVGTTAILVTHDQQEAMMMADRMAVMLEGSIEQVDAPDVIYHYPANRAVAKFVGQGTFVPATVAGSVADSDLGTFELERNSAAEKVDLLLRPRDVTIEVDPDGIAYVVSRTFQGAEFTYLVQLPCGVQLISNQPSHVDVSPGARVRVRCNRVRLAAYDNYAQVAMTSPPPEVMPPSLSDLSTSSIAPAPGSDAGAAESTSRLSD